MKTKSLEKILNNETENYIFPFLWMKGESQEVIAEELERIYDCGIRAVCIESRPHPDFLGEGWWKDMDLIMAKAREKGMRVWLLDDAHFPTGYANHLIPEKYPERKKRYINYNVQDVWGAKSKVTMPIDCMMQPRTTWMDLGKPVDLAERANNRPISITAYPLVEDARVELEGALDLMPYYEKGKVTYQFPQGNWRIYVVYETRTDGGNPDYINIIDEDSVAVLIEAVYEAHYQHYKEDFGTTFAGFFSDEPGFGNVLGFDMDDIIGKKQMPLPWSQDVPKLLKERLGEQWHKLLAALWTDTVDFEKTAQVRLAYMDTVTALYAKNFCGQLGRWCKERKVEYVGHVIEDKGEHARLGCGAGHYFRAMSGQHMAGIDSIGQQIMPGGADVQHMAFTSVSGKFYHYVLARLGSSSAHMDPPKQGRVFCEACGAYGWRFGVRDMKWLIDHLMAQGVNHFVPHAFSMAEYPDGDCPPHFYARGNNPQYKHFAELMKYTNRMCELFNGGYHGARTAVLYQAEAEWMGSYMDMEEVAKILTNHQVDFDFVPVDVLADLTAYEGSMEGGCMRINGQEYRLLLIPYADCIPAALDEFVAKHPEFDVQFVGGYPRHVISPFSREGTGTFKEKGGMLELSGLAEYAKRKASTVTLTEEFPNMLVYDHVKDGRIYLFFNADMYREYDGDVVIEGEKQFLCYDGWNNTCIPVECHTGDGKTRVHLRLPIYQTCVLMEAEEGICRDTADGKRAPGGSLTRKEKAFSGSLALEKDALAEQLDLSHGWKVSACRSIDYPHFTNEETIQDLEAYSDRYPEFSGFIRYEKSFELPEALPEAVFSFEHVYECMELWVDGESCGKCVCPPYRYMLPQGLAAGEHIIRVEVATTLDREQQTMPKPPFQYIFKSMEPTGMFGRVMLEGSF